MFVYVCDSRVPAGAWCSLPDTRVLAAVFATARLAAIEVKYVCVCVCVVFVCVSAVVQVGLQVPTPWLVGTVGAPVSARPGSRSLSVQAHSS